MKTVGAATNLHKAGDVRNASMSQVDQMLHREMRALPVVGNDPSLITIFVPATYQDVRQTPAPQRLNNRIVSMRGGEEQSIDVSLAERL
jgi:hypothetical protein